MFARFVSFVVVILFLKLPKSKLVNEAVALEGKTKFRTNTSDSENSLAYKKYDSLVQELLVTFVALNSLYDSAQSEEFNNTETRLSKARSNEDVTEKPYFQGTNSFFVDEQENKKEDKEYDSLDEEQETFKNEEVLSKKIVHTNEDEEHKDDTFKNEEVPPKKNLHTDTRFSILKNGEEYKNNKNHKLLQDIQPVIQFESSNETITNDLSKYEEHGVVSSECQVDDTNSDEENRYVGENPTENAHRSNTEIKNKSSSFATQNAVKFLNSIGDFINYHKLSRRGTLKTNSKQQYKESKRYDMSAAYYPISIRARGLDDIVENNKLLKLQNVTDPIFENLKSELEKSVADVKEKKERFRSDLLKQIIVKKIHFDTNSMRQANLTEPNLKQQTNATDLNLELQTNLTELSLKRQTNSTEQNLKQQSNPISLNSELQSNSTERNVKRQHKATSLDTKSIKNTTGLDIHKTDVMSKQLPADKEWSMEDKLKVKKEQVIRNILRRAFGEACTKDAIRKCYMASIKAEKAGCRRVWCSAKFVAIMKENTRTGCIRHFTKIPEHRNYSDLLYRTGKINDVYYRNLSNIGIPIEANVPPGHTKELNILRDRYEKACQEDYAKKCEQGCHYGINAACSTFDCRRKRVRGLQHDCKKECLRAYKPKRTSSSISSSGSSEDSGSDSGSCSKDGGKSGSISRSGSCSKEKSLIIPPLQKNHNGKQDLT